MWAGECKSNLTTQVLVAPDLPIQDKESDGAKANFDVDEEVQQAASTLIADMTIEPRADVEVKGQVVEVEGYKNNDFKNCIVNTHQRIAQNVLLQVTFLQTKRFHQNTIAEYQYWAIHPGNKHLCEIRTFLLGQILCIFQDNQPCRSSCHENPSTMYADHQDDSTEL